MGRTACTEPQYLYKGCTLPLHDLECVRVKPRADFLKGVIISEIHNVFKSGIATHLQNCWFPLCLLYLRQNIGDNLFLFKTIAAQRFAWDVWDYLSEVGEDSRLLSFNKFFPTSPPQRARSAPFFRVKQYYNKLTLKLRYYVLGNVAM